MTYAYCDWIFIVADPGPAWMVNIETNCRATNTFLLLTTNYKQSKGFALWADIIMKTEVAGVDHCVGLRSGGQFIDNTEPPMGIADQ